MLFDNNLYQDISKLGLKEATVVGDADVATQHN